MLRVPAFGWKEVKAPERRARSGLVSAIHAPRVSRSRFVPFRTGLLDREWAEMWFTHAAISS